MAAIYGMLVALPMVWGCAGYVLVSQPGTAEPIDSRAAAKLIARTRHWARMNVPVFAIHPPIRQHYFGGRCCKSRGGSQ